RDRRGAARSRRAARLRRPPRVALRRRVRTLAARLLRRRSLAPGRGRDDARPRRLPRRGVAGVPGAEAHPGHVPPVRDPQGLAAPAAAASAEAVERLVDLRSRDRQRRRRLQQRPVETGGDDEHAARERVAGAARSGAQQAASVPAGALEALPLLANVVEERRQLLEQDERGRAGERIADVGVCVDVCRPELPQLLEPLAVEERRREREAAAERLADADDVRELRSRPRLADPPEAGVDRVDDEERTGLVAALAQTRQECVGGHPRAGPSLHRLDDDAGGVARQRPGILAVGVAMHRARQPSAEGLAGGGEGEQAGAVVGALEGDDSRAAGGEMGRPEGDLDRVLAGDAELRRTRQRATEALRHLRLGEVAERVDDRLLAPRGEDPRVAVAERGHAEAAGEVEQLATVRERHTAPFRVRPDHERPSTRPTVARAIVPAIAGFSCSRRSEYSYQWRPNGT